MLKKLCCAIERRRNSDNVFLKTLVLIKDKCWGYYVIHVNKRLISIKSNCPVIVIWQMGKVGSTTIYQSLLNANLSYQVYKIHGVNSFYYSNSFFNQFNIGLINNSITNFYIKAEHLNHNHSICLFNLMRSNKPVLNWKIISLTRDPISTMISYFFSMIYHLQTLNGEPLVKNNKVDINLVMDLLQKGFMNFNETSNFQCAWFDENIKKVCEIDVYNHNFDHEQSYSIIKEKNYEILLIRLEDLDKHINTTLLQFIGLNKPITIHKVNVASEKNYYEEYKYVLNHIIIPKEVCERIYSSKYAIHFYSDEERNNFIKKWSNPRI